MELDERLEGHGKDNGDAEPTGPTEGDENLPSPPVLSARLANLVEEIRKYYYPLNPPFVSLSKKGRRAGDVHSLVLAAEDGKYPQAPVKRVDIVWRHWSDSSVFSTLELDGISHIVKSISGGVIGGCKGGAAYRLWEGPEKGFSKLPVAFPDNGSIAAGTATRRVTTSPRLVAPSTQASSKRSILCASKPLRTSHNGLVYNWTNPNDNDDLPTRRAKPRRSLSSTGSNGIFSENAFTRGASADFAEDSSESESSSSSESEDHVHSSPHAPRASRCLPTPRTSLPKTVSSPNSKTFRPTESTTSSVRGASNLTPDEVDELVLQLKKEGKSFHDIRDHMDNMMGGTTTRNTWSSRYYNRIMKKTSTSGTNVTPSKQVVIPNKSTNRQVYNQNQSREEVMKTLVRLREEEGKMWKDIGLTMDEMTGQKNTPGNWCSRYKRYMTAKNGSKDKGTTPSKRSTSSKKSFKRQLGDSGDETVEADFKKKAPKTSCNLRAPGEQSVVQQPPPVRFRAVNSRYSPTSALYFGEAGKVTTDQPTKPAIAEAPIKPTVTDRPTKPTVFSESILAPHKLNRTVLRISHAGSFIPLKLRSCPTMSELFIAVLNMCGMINHKDNVEALKATLTWLRSKDDGRTMLLKEGFEDSFEFFLESIDEAPCWEKEEKNGKCIVGIEVVLRNISGEPMQNTWVGRWPASDVH